MAAVKTIQGGVARDYRGQIRFVNGFDMTLVKRFYIIKNNDIELIRGWRAHRIEQRWFYVLSGTFSLSLVKIDNWENADPNLPVDHHILNESDLKIVHVPAGYATAFRALQDGSELLVYADYPIEHAAVDDYSWETDYFINHGLSQSL
ncbi:dTDP-4-dehydrorhamnose 3,5-epimerase-like enzyme [Sphingobacterium zeae]|uniref:dTDP-4-dehydrorhamnose 3,5-epimerase-like enzyme n=1 Tax=Sphingobacterium zeae TaxID=1776859 RepID=A0ABU0TZI8_9SPHI|nr:WxcM-like domain-containing protein [Sphingobacterium zeae]MDQ1148127.1 dTDP-4-dehydrorhamnose 3,5-epimerase-like enzyme [Sphingobacterium zeae]